MTTTSKDACPATDKNVCPTDIGVLVVGIGSLIRGDDGAGRLVADRLADSLRPDVTGNSGGPCSCTAGGGHPPEAAAEDCGPPGRIVASRPLGVEVMSVHQLTPELAEVVSRSSVFVVVDTSAVDPPGRLVCREVQPSAGIDPGAHICTPASLLAWSRWLYGRFPPAFIFSVGGESFEITEQLSAKVQRGAAELQRQMEDYVRGLQGWLSAGKPGTIPIPPLLSAG